MKKYFLLFLFILLFYSPTSTFANDSKISCNNRYVTFVNPVRSRSLWHDKSLKPLDDQYGVIKQNNFAATWLLQNDVFSDSKLREEIKKFDNKQELGVFLEVSENLATEAKVIYPPNTPWFRPQAIFLSGYSLGDREKLIDKMFKTFKENVGFYPKSVGAWWVDSYSLGYIKKKYNIKSVLIVADQKTTDNYGVWGQWWGAAYYPNKNNILIPASSIQNQVDTIVLQWAQRDPQLAYGVGPAVSNYSLQANDYINQGKDTEYFKELINSYLDCTNDVGQITVGLETGIESVGSIGEYRKQLQYLKTVKSIKAVTMSGFYDSYKRVHPLNPDEVTIGKNGSEWSLTTKERTNNKLKDHIIYDQTLSFSDNYVPDRNDFLNRDLSVTPSKNASYYKPLFLGFIIILFAFLVYLKQEMAGIVWIMLIAAGFGLEMKAKIEHGWQVFYGPVFSNIEFTQIVVCIIGFLTIILWKKFLLGKIKRFNRNSAFLLFMPLSFAIDGVIAPLRFTILEGKYFFGYITNPLHFVGFGVSKSLGIGFLNTDFPSAQAQALLKIVPYKLVEGFWKYTFVNLAIHIFVALAFSLVYYKLPGKAKKVFLVMLFVFYILHLITILNADPISVKPA